MVWTLVLIATFGSAIAVDTNLTFANEPACVVAQNHILGEWQKARQTPAPVMDCVFALPKGSPAPNP